MSRAAALVDILLGVALTLIAGVAASALGGWLLARWQLPLLSLALVQGVVVIAGVHALLRWRGEGWRALGLVPPRLVDLPRALGALLLVFAVNAGLAGVVQLLAPELLAGHQQRLGGVAQVMAAGVPMAAVAAVMLFVGFYEEVLARGWLLGRSRRLLPGRWPPVLLSSVLFGLGHGYQGAFGVAQTAVIGVVLALLFLRWRTLWPLILAHGLLNTIAIATFRAMAAGG